MLALPCLYTHTSYAFVGRENCNEMINDVGE